MAILKQKSNIVYYQGWYGLCKDDEAPCTPFQLVSGSTLVHSEIHEIFEISSNAEGELRYDGSLTEGSAISLLPIKELECGKCYRIALKSGSGQVNIPDFSYASADDSDDQQDIANRITNDCSASGGDTSEYALSVISAISDTLDEGYENSDATDFDAEAHTSVITSSKGVASVSIQADGSGLQYSMNGTDWSDLTTSVSTISSNFTNLQLRVKTGLSAGTYNRAITLVATPENSQYVSLDKVITYSVVVNNVALSASDTISEELEEGATGSVHEIEISHENIKTINVDVVGDFYGISSVSDGTYGNTLNITPGVSPTKIYAKLKDKKSSSAVESSFLNITGERRNSGNDIVLTNAVSLSATLAPRPQITSLSVDPNTLEISISVENTDNYLAHHWHYYVKDADGNEVVGMKMPGFPEGGFPNATIPFDFPVAGVYTVCAKIVTEDHKDIAGSIEVEEDFTIAANDATLSANKVGISEILDIDENATTHVISISSNNLSNITSTSAFDNWDVLSATDSSISVKLKDSVKSTDLSSGFVDLPQETITITGDVGPRDTSGDSVKTVTITLNAKLVDDAEFSVTPKTGDSLTITDSREFGSSMVEYGPYTVSGDAVTVSSGTLTNWEVEFDDSDSWSSSPDFASKGEGGYTFKLRQTATAVGTYNETLTITPSAKPSDHDSSDDPSAVTLTLNGAITALSSSLTNPGTQTLSSVTSGDTPSDKTFVVAGNRIENISITNVSSGWSVTPANPNLGDTVTVSYTGNAVGVGTKTGQFTISAEAIEGSTLSTTSYTVNMAITVTHKVATFATSENSVTLTPFNTGEASTSAELDFATSNVEEVELRVIPSEFTIKVGGVEKSSEDVVPVNATLVITKSNNFEAGVKTGTLALRATASANSKFSGNASTFDKAVILSGDVVGETTIMTIDPTSVTDTFEALENANSIKTITLTTAFVSQVDISGGNANKYQVSSSESGPFTNSLSISNPAASSSFYVKFEDTSTSGTFTTNFTLVGTKTANGEANPGNKTLSCTATVNALPVATLTLDKSSVSLGDVEFDSTPSAVAVGMTKANVDSVTISGGNANGFQVSKTENGTYKNSISFASVSFANGDGESFYVKLMNTSTSGNVSTTLSITGTHSNGGDDPSPISLVCSAVVSEEPTPTPTPVAEEVLPDKLWIGFAKDASTFYSWYELDAAETQEVIDFDVTDFMAGGFGWNDFYGQDPVKAISDGTKYDKVKHVDESGYNPFSSTEFGFLSEYFASYTEMADAMQVGNISGDGTGAEFRKVVVPSGRSSVTKWLVSFIAPLSYTQFKFKDEDFYSSLMTEIGSAGQLAYAMVTASPSQPNKSSLTDTEVLNSYNNEFLRLKCGDTWNGDQTDGTKKAILKAKFDSSDDGSNVIATASYTAQVSTNTLLTSGTWNGCNAIFASGQFNNSNGNRPRIKYFYFETQSGSNLLKFSDSGTSQPQCI